MKEDKCAFKILTGKPAGKRALDRLMRTWKDDVRMNLKEVGASTRN